MGGGLCVHECVFTAAWGQLVLETTSDCRSEDSIVCLICFLPAGRSSSLEKVLVEGFDVQGWGGGGKKGAGEHFL